MFAYILNRLLWWIPSVLLVMLAVYALAFYGAGDPIKLIFLRAPGDVAYDPVKIEAIRAIRAAGQEVMFYPFILMEQQPENGRPDPWSDAPDQPVMPWRGRITGNAAPGSEAQSGISSLGY